MACCKDRYSSASGTCPLFPIQDAQLLDLAVAHSRESAAWSISVVEVPESGTMLPVPEA